MSDKESFLFSGWPVEVHRRAFRRSVSIYLYPRQPIKVMAGKKTSQKIILDFLLTKKSWIEKAFEKFEAIEERFPAKKIQAQEQFPFLGRSLSLKVVITLNKKTFVSATDENLLLHIPRNQWSQDSSWQEHPSALQHIRQFYKREAERILKQRVQHWSVAMNLHPSQVKFREQRTRWGSCSSKQIINLNWRLVVFPLEIVDYVIVHELAHLRYMDHSPRFWALVEQYVENYKDCIKVLKDSQYQVEFLTPL